MLNPIFWKKVQGQKHPGRWDIAERHIPSVKMLLKTNTKGHKHRSIRIFSIEQDTVGKPMKQKVEVNPGPPPPTTTTTTKKNSPFDCDGVQFHQYWTTLLV